MRKKGKHMNDPGMGRAAPLDVGLGGSTVMRAGADDAAELLVLQRCCWVQEAIANDTLDIAALHESLDEVKGWIAEWEVWCLRLNAPVPDGRSTGRLIGAVRAKREHNSWEIGRLMVAPDQSGRGHGRWLLTFIEGCAPDTTTSLSLFTGAHSTRNIAIYERAGYKLRNATTAPPGTVQLTKTR
jgi:GNAT superfamily N-acetyltransferase